MTIGPLDPTEAVGLLAIAAVQVAVATAAYFLGREGRSGRGGAVRPPARTAEARGPASQEIAARLQQLFQLAPDALLLCRPDGIVLDVNAYTSEVTGYAREELVGRSLAALRFLEGESREQAAADFARLAAGRETMHAVQLSIRRRNGALLPVEIRGVRLPWEGGASVLISARNISEHKKAEARIREQQARLTLLFEQLPAHVWTTDRDLRITSAAGRGLASLGVTEADLIGRRVPEAMSGSPATELSRRLHEQALSGCTGAFSTTLVGNEIEGAVGPLRDESGNVEGVIGIGLNVSEEARAKRRLQQREALLEQAQMMANMGSWEWDMETGDVYWSPDLYRLLALDPDVSLPTETPGDEVFRAYLSLVVREDRERMRRAIEAAIREGKSYSVEHRVRLADGRMRWLLASGRVEHDAQGKPRRFYGFVQDIDAQKAYADEVRRLNAQLEARVSERTRQLEAAVEDLRSFSYAVSHDLRQPLRTIDGFLVLLEEESRGVLGEEACTYLNRVRGAAQRMDALIGDLLALSRVTDAPLARTRLDLSAMARETARELSLSDPRRKAEWEIEPGLAAEADHGMVRLVLENLLGNAWKFTRGREPARIEFGVEPGAASGGRQAGAGSPIDETVFFVRDNGAGFDPSQAPRLFQPFQRLHDAAEFEGTGVGLATVGRIIRRHGGTISAEGRRGAGATFRFSLPACRETPPA